ncbi:Erp60, partial [Caligus rogercresseyi]
RNRTKKASFEEEEEGALSSRQCTLSQVIENYSKINRIGFRTATTSTIFSRSGPSDYWLFAELKKVLRGRKFRSDNDVIAETEEYFEGLEKSFFAGGIERLEK